MSDPRLSGIYAVLDADLYGESLVSAAEDLASGGIRIFQYRAKRRVEPTALAALHAITTRHNALLFVNDYYEFAQSVDGLHLGQDDLQGTRVDALKRQAPHCIIGVSAHTRAQIDAAPFADYFGIGPLHETFSKQVTRPPLGLDEIAELARCTSTPVCAIGGITARDIPAIARSPIAMAACIGAFAHAADYRAVATEYVQLWHENRLCG